MLKLSVVINTLNEEKKLPRAIASVVKIAFEVVVVDMKSDDKTREVAKSLGAKVYEHERTNYVEPARNFAISQATGDWILILDADEEASDALRGKIKEIVNSPSSADYYYIPRKNIIFGKWIKYSRWWPDYNIRLFRKGTVLWSEIIHSVPTTKGKGVELEAKEDLAIIHFHYDSLDQYIERMNRYTTEHAKLLIRNGYKFDWKDLIRKPVSEFLSRYFFGRGHQEGLHGFSVCSLQAFSELVLYLKIWQMGKFQEQKIGVKDVVSQMKESEREIHYWQADTLYKVTKNPIEKIKRKLRI